MESFEIFIVLTVLLFLLISLYADIFHPISAFLISVSILVLTGILQPEDVLIGFSNEHIAVIILLLIITKIIQKTGVINYYFSKIFLENDNYNKFLSKLFLSVSSMSAFFNNTPIVAMLIPYVSDWARKKNIPPSKLLIPLSYASILGGTITLIGTSTNLIVNGFTVANGLHPFEMFDFAYVGIPATLFGFIYIITLGSKMLPSREDILEQFLQKKREYIIETKINIDSKLIGKTVIEANLRNLKGLFLVEIIRNGKRITPVSPNEILEEEDILLFVGDTNAISYLLNSDIGLSLPDYCILNGGFSNVVEVFIPYNSSLVNKRVKDTDFRGKFDAAILAIHRNGEKLRGKIGNIVLKPGDLLLLLTGKDFWKRAEDTTDFYIISQLKNFSKLDLKKGNILFWSFVFVIFLSVFEIVSLFTGLLVLISILILLKIMPYSEIKKGIDLNLLVIAALSISMAKAITKSGVADFLAFSINSIFSPLGVLGGLIGIYLITNILTEFITNISAASISFPIALSLANYYTVEPYPFILAVAYAASASFVTPIGYQTNLMVYAAGGYKFKDFMKVGFPLSFGYAIICISILYLKNF